MHVTILAVRRSTTKTTKEIPPVSEVRAEEPTAGKKRKASDKSTAQPQSIEKTPPIKRQLSSSISSASDDEEKIEKDNKGNNVIAHTT